MLPSKIVALFEAVDAFTSDETEIYGPYNALLDFCFPWEEGWNVIPQFRQPRKRDTIDFTTVFVVSRQQVPVLFLDAKPGFHICNCGARASADEQMRDLFFVLGEDVVTARLHAFSALGNQLSHYKLVCENMELTPHEVPRSPRHVTDTAPASSWNIDILTEDGFACLMEIVADVKYMNLLTQSA